VWYLFMQIYLT